MKKIFVTIIISIFIMPPLCLCQIYKEDIPVSFLYDLNADIETYDLNAQFSRVQDVPRIEIIEDDTIEFFDPIIGELFNVPININSIGTWSTIDNGDSIWQIQINSEVGNYMMLIFDDFYLPQGSKLFVYSTNRDQILGAFTEDNNVPSNKFTTAPLNTNSLVIEYHKPYYIKEQAKLNLKSVGLINELYENDLTREFGDSGSCMINVMCPEYDQWCNQRRSVAMILRVLSADSTIRWCTGSLLTNERRDGKPFFLTAFHCLDCNKNGTVTQEEKDDVQNWLFSFNYQSSGCSNPTTDPPLLYFISGATYLKGISYDDDGTDYALLQLNQKPPKNYNVYYNGWSNEKKDDMTSTGVCIHHPKGDIKKISTWKKGNTTNKWFWKVKWTKGYIDHGSSGSPLFTSSGYVVGQLSHGRKEGNCSNLKGSFFFGRFHRSWNNFGLSWILNPNGTFSGNNENYILSMSGDETCKQNWTFNNCNDLHTSANVSFLNPSTIRTRQYDGVYNAKNQITAENTTIQSGTKVVFEAGNKIVLKPGFCAQAGSNFIAKIGDCELGCNNGKNTDDGDYEMAIFDSNIDTDTSEKNMNDDTNKTIKNVEVIDNSERAQGFSIYPNPNQGFFSIQLTSI